MQNKELYFIIQVTDNYRYLNKSYGYIPVWKDLDMYPCGLKQKDYSSAERKAETKLQEYKDKDFLHYYRIIKRYIHIEENDLQLHLF